MSRDDKAKLIQEYEELRRKAHKLNVQANTVDQRLVELERVLPKRYVFPGDPPQREGARRSTA